MVAISLFLKQFRFSWTNFDALRRIGRTKLHSGGNCFLTWISFRGIRFSYHTRSDVATLSALIIKRQMEASLAER